MYGVRKKIILFAALIRYVQENSQHLKCLMKMLVYTSVYHRDSIESRRYADTSRVTPLKRMSRVTQIPWRLKTSRSTLTEM